MKRLLCIVAAVFSAAALFASEELDIYTYLYRESSTFSERLGVLQGVAEAKIDGAGQLYATALSDLLLTQSNLRGAEDKDAADESARLLSQLLGEAKYVSAAGDLWKVVQAFSNPLVKADALIAMGRIRSPEYTEQVVKTLNDLNLKPTADPEAGEKIAYGCILALEKLRDPSGYLPVFFASNAWYNKRIKEQAANSLPFIIDDPSQPLTKVLTSSTYAYDSKALALTKMEESKASEKSKAAVAVTALSEGWRAATMDVKQNAQLANMRKLSIDMIKRYRTDNVDVIPLLERSYKEGFDTDEKIGAVLALSSIGSESSARALSSFLMMLNSKRKAGNITQEDERFVRIVIPALGATKQTVGRPVLQTVAHLDWTNAVKVLAADALKQLP